MPQAERNIRTRFGHATLLLGAALSSAMLLTSCSSDSSAFADGATVLEVSLGRMVINPAVLEAPAGDLVLKVTNDDTDLVHDLVAYGKGTRRLSPGESQTLEIPGVVEGQYRVWCDMPGHAAAGQTATLVITPASPATTAP